MYFLDCIVAIVVFLLGVIGTLGKGRTEKGKLTFSAYITIALLLVSASATIILKIQVAMQQKVSQKQQEVRYRAVVNQVQRSLYPLELTSATIRLLYKIDAPQYAQLRGSLESVLYSLIPTNVLYAKCTKSETGVSSSNIVGYNKGSSRDQIITFSIGEYGLQSAEYIWNIFSHSSGTLFDHESTHELANVVNGAYYIAIVDNCYTNDVVTEQPSDSAVDEFLSSRRVHISAEFGSISARTATAHYYVERKVLEVIVCSPKITLLSNDGRLVSMFDLNNKCLAFHYGCGDFEANERSRPILFPVSMKIIVAVGSWRHLNATPTLSNSFPQNLLISAPLSIEEAGIDGLQMDTGGL